MYIRKLQNDYLNRLISPQKRNAVAGAVLSALSTLASPQVRNVATVGGNVMWDSRGSDLRAVYLAAACKVQRWEISLKV